ncbi:hypothetical protein C7G83_09630 [Siccibacter turicensis]|uniref:Uncharacterized protein n=1 Tax=Siccibacter turicensis TaxID=357233 RepID=A0A2P8VLI8_9ENTR|nr:hypothetical protein C7G83_09630 [Siccibacter turicensis]
MTLRRSIARARIRILRRCQALIMPGRPSDSQLLLEAFIPTGYLYGIDYGNIDPAWYRAR